jgi:predicted RNA-binding Zn ribbon-like protein
MTHVHGSTPQPPKRLPAPEPLRLVQDFVNTRDIEEDRDDLVKPDDLKEFLKERDLIPARATLSPADLERARDVREAIRALLAANTGDPLDTVALRKLNRAAEASPMTVRFDEEGSTLLPRQSGIDGALGRIIGTVFRSMADGTWTRLKACRRHTCQWAFYDASKNGSSRWCSMRVCGNREKAKSFRRRQTAG